MTGYVKELIIYIYGDNGDNVQMEKIVEYQEFIDSIVKILNKYSILQNIQIEFLDCGTISFSEAIVMKEILMNGDQNMTSLASKLGVTKAAITKTIKKLENRGLLLRYNKVTNKKEIFVMLTKQGDIVYNSYRNFIYESLLKNIFHLVDQYDNEYFEMMNKLVNSVDNSLTELCKEMNGNNDKI